MNEYIKSDLYRYIGNTNLKSFFYCYRKEAGFRFSVAFRLINSKGWKKILGVVLWIFRNKQLIQIARNTQIGYGLYISHGGPVVINPSTVIGNNVYIGPSCCIVENVVIGDNVTVGAGSVVTKDLPNNSTCAGNYAKVLNFNNPGRYIQNKYGE